MLIRKIILLLEEDWEEECVAQDYDSDDNEGWIDVSSEGENDDEVCDVIITCKLSL